MELGRWEPRCDRPDGLVTPRGLDRSGCGEGITPGVARGPWFRRTSPGRYVPIQVDESVVEQRILEQGSRLRGTGAVTGWASLRWQGAAYFTGLDVEGNRRPVPLLVGPALVRGDERVVVTQEQIFPAEILSCGEIRCTRADRATFDEIRDVSQWSVREAVVAGDMAIAAKLISADQLRSYVAARRSWTGVPRAREVVALVRDGSRSPQETRMRLIWVLDAQLPNPLINREVYDRAGHLIGIPDLLDPVAGVVGEYDGGDHRRRDRRRKDIARLERFADHGLVSFVIVEGDLRDRDAVRRRMLAARERASFLPEERRRWALDPPGPNAA